MRLQKHGSRKVEGKEYFKWTLVLPPDTVKELGWEEGEELEPEADGGKLVVKRLSRNASRLRSPSRSQKGDG